MKRVGRNYKALIKYSDLLDPSIILPKSGYLSRDEMNLNDSAYTEEGRGCVFVITDSFVDVLYLEEPSLFKCM